MRLFERLGRHRRETRVRCTDAVESDPRAILVIEKRVVQVVIDADPSTLSNYCVRFRVLGSWELGVRSCQLPPNHLDATDPARMIVSSRAEPVEMIAAGTPVMSSRRAM